MTWGPVALIVSVLVLVVAALFLGRYLAAALIRYSRFVREHRRTQRDGSRCGGCGATLEPDTFFCDSVCRAKAAEEDEWWDAIR